MPQLYFIRHGQTKLNVDGIMSGTIEAVLSEKGINDAKILDKKLTEKFDYYYCSPLKRTHQTLKEIKGDVDFIIDNRLIEVNSGDWQGLPKTKLPEKEYTLYKKGLLDPPNGVTMEEIDKRINSFLQDIFNKYSKNEKILIVTHNAFMRSLKRLFIDKDKVTEPKNLEIFKIDDLMYKNISITN